MRIGIVLGEQAQESGGAYTFQQDVIHSLIQSVPSSKHEFHVLCTRESEAIYREQIAGSNSIRLIPELKSTVISRTLSKLMREFSFIRKLKKIFKYQTQIERIATQHDIQLIWFLSPWATFIDIPYITIVWDLQHRLQPWFPEVSNNGEWDSREDSFSWFLRRASLVIAGTEVGKKEIQDFYQIPAQRIKILPHPTPHFAPESSQENSIDIRKKYQIQNEYLFYPAQFWPHKNHANLLAAVKILSEEYATNLDLVLVGSDKGNKAYVEHLARQYGIEKQIKFLGFVPRKDLKALYSHAFALTYVTYFGPENLPPLEAFSLRCPVIASNVSGAEEQFGDAAQLVDPSSPEAIAEAVIRLKEDCALRTNLIERGFVRANKWTATDFVQGLMPFFDDFDRVLRCWKNN